MYTLISMIITGPCHVYFNPYMVVHFYFDIYDIQGHAKYTLISVMLTGLRHVYFAFYDDYRVVPCILLSLS
jgi:hypothetical protein